LWPASAAEEGLHLCVCVFLLCDCAGHRLLSYAVLRPRVFVEAVVEEICLICAGQPPRFAVLGEIGVYVDLHQWLAVIAAPDRVRFDIDAARPYFGKVFAFFSSVS
jgi:hypothetical protein